MITFVEITKNEYDQLTNKPFNTVYFVSDTGQICFNGVTYGKTSQTNTKNNTITIQNKEIEKLRLDNSQYISYLNEAKSQAAFKIPTADENKAGVTSVDNIVSDTSTNPIQNKIIKQYVDDNKVIVNGLKGDLKLQSGVGISLTTNNADKSIVINSLQGDFVNTNNTKTFVLDGKDTDELTYNTNDNSILVTHNLTSRCITIIYDENNKQIDADIYYVNDNSIRIKFNNNDSMPTNNKIKTLCVGAIGCPEKYIYVNGVKPALEESVDHAQYLTVGVLSQSKSVKFNQYFANKINKIQLWLVSDFDVTENVILTVGNNTYQLTITNTLTKYTLNLQNSISGVVEINRVKGDTQLSDVLLVDYMLYYQNQQQTIINKPFYISNANGEIKINALNSSNQIVECTGNLCMKNDNIVNLAENEMVKIMVKNKQHYDVIVNNQYIDRNIENFYVMFVNINGYVKQIGNIVQAE